MGKKQTKKTSHYFIFNVLCSRIATSFFVHKSLKDKAIPVQALTGPEGFKSLRLPRFKDNRHMKVAKLSALRTGRLYLQ
jgi:hypothetical protein